MSTRTNKRDAPMCGRDAKAKKVKNQHQIHLLRTYVMFLMGQSSQDDDVPDYLISTTIEHRVKLINIGTQG